MIREGEAHIYGQCRGEAIVLDAPLSFYGGVNPLNGEIIDRASNRLGDKIAGKILVLPAGRGSSSSSSVLAEALRLRTGPVGIVIGQVDAIMVAGCIVAEKLYDIVIPIISCPIGGIEDGDVLSITCLPDAIATLAINNADDE